jgi:zinc protease
MGPRRAKYRERILGQTLKNGLRVVMLPDKRSNLVMVGVHYAVGGSDDPNSGEGLAHYVEHVMFEAGYRGPDGNALRDVGLDKNAWTSFDRTFFYLKALDVELESPHWRSRHVGLRRRATTSTPLRSRVSAMS